MLAYRLIALLGLGVGASFCQASEIVATSGSTDGGAGPSFWFGSYYPVSPQIKRAFSLTIEQQEPMRLETLIIAAHRRDGGGVGVFSVRSDNAGAPGSRLGLFVTQDIDADQEHHELAIVDGPVTISPGETFWLVAETLGGELRWNLAAGADGNGFFGDTAFLRPGGQWTPQNSNLAAFTLLGVPIPEPPGALLLALGIVGRQRRRHKLDDSRRS